MLFALPIRAVSACIGLPFMPFELTQEGGLLRSKGRLCRSGAHRTMQGPGPVEIYIFYVVAALLLASAS